jgi:hypothetical protein
MVSTLGELQWIEGPGLDYLYSLGGPDDFHLEGQDWGCL